MKRRIDFIKSLGLDLGEAQLALLESYADLVLQKMGDLNLTAAEDKQEIWDRHILDGLAAAAVIFAKTRGAASAAADYGAGAGFIGIAIAVALPGCKVSLVESLQKRCAFLEWVIFKLGIKNIEVLNIRAEADTNLYDFTTERAMGKIDDILPACAARLKAGGYFLPYQAADGVYDQQIAQKSGVREEEIFNYTLPGGNKPRKLLIFKKYGNNDKN